MIKMTMVNMMITMIMVARMLMVIMMIMVLNISKTPGGLLVSPPKVAELLSQSCRNAAPKSEPEAPHFIEIQAFGTHFGPIFRFAGVPQCGSDKTTTIVEEVSPLARPATSTRQLMSTNSRLNPSLVRSGGVEPTAHVD